MTDDPKPLPEKDIQVGDPKPLPKEGLRVELFSEPFSAAEPSGAWEWDADGEPVRVGGRNDGLTASQIRQQNAPCSCPAPFDARTPTVHADDCPLKETK